MSLVEQLNKVTITHIILMSLVLHVFVIAQPQHLQMWDESIFLELLRDFLKGEDHVSYQLPGFYFFAGAAVSIFGDNWFSWRAPQVIFGMLTLLVFYKILCKITSEKNSLLATTILSFDTIFFVHSTLFLRDVPLIFFGMLSFYLYLKNRYYLAALVLGFSFLIKETAILFLIFIAIYHIGITKPWKKPNKNVKMVPIFLCIVAASFLLPLWVYDIIYQPIIYDPMMPTEKSADGRDLAIGYPAQKVIESRGYTLQEPIGKVTNPIEHFQVILGEGHVFSAVANVKNWNPVHTHYAWNWVLPIPLPDNNSYGWVAKRTIDETWSGILHQGEVFGIEWRGDPNLSLWVIGFWSSVAFVIYSTIKFPTKAALFLGGGIVSMYVPYLLLSLSGRITFPYMFITTVPFVSLGIILVLDRIKNHKIRYLAKFIMLASVVAWFVWFYPLEIIS